MKLKLQLNSLHILQKNTFLLLNSIKDVTFYLFLSTCLLTRLIKNCQSNIHEILSIIGHNAGTNR